MINLADPVSLLLIPLVFGLMPGVLLRVLVRLYPQGHPRREELLGELYSMGYWRRPIFVAEVVETALAEGLSQRWRARKGLAREACSEPELSPVLGVALAGGIVTWAMVWALLSVGPTALFWTVVLMGPGTMLSGALGVKAVVVSTELGSEARLGPPFKRSPQGGQATRRPKPLAVFAAALMSAVTIGAVAGTVLGPDGSLLLGAVLGIESGLGMGAGLMVTRYSDLPVRAAMAKFERGPIGLHSAQAGDVTHDE